MEVMSDGKEKELESSMEEPGETKESAPPVTRRVIRRTVQEPTGREKVVEEPEFVTPLEVTTTEETEPEIQEKLERGVIIRTVRRRSLVTTQRRVVRRVAERVDGKQEGPIEDEMEEPVEPKSYKMVKRTLIKPDGRAEVIEEPEYVMPEERSPEVQEEKDRKGVVIRRIVHRPVPVVTARKVYRTIILTPDGKEESVEEKVEEPVPPQEEVVVPMEYAETEALPDEPTRRQIFRAPVPIDVAQEPTPEEIVTLEDGRIIRRTVTVRKRTIRKIIILPDGTRKEVEEEVPDESPEERSSPEPDVTPVERRIIRTVVRHPDGSDRIISQKEALVPLHGGLVIDDQQKIAITHQRIVVRRLHGFPDGKEIEIEKKMIEQPESERPIEPELDVLRKVQRSTDGKGEIVEEPLEVSPLESSYSEYDTPEVEKEDKVEGVRVQIIKRQEKKTTQKTVLRMHRDDILETPEDLIAEPVEKRVVFVRKVIDGPDGKEVIIEKPQLFEPLTSKPEQVEEIKGSRGEVIRKVVRRSVPVTTRRTVIRTVIVSPEGEEKEFEESTEEQPVTVSKIEPDEEEPERLTSTKRKLSSDMPPKMIVLPDGTRKAVDDAEDVERRVVRRVVRYRDGTENLIDEYEVISPLEATQVDERPKEEKVCDKKGHHVKTFVYRKVFVTVKTIVVRKVVEDSDGSETELERSVEERPDGSHESDVPLRSRTVQRFVPDGEGHVSEHDEFLSPLEESYKEEEPGEVEKEETDCMGRSTRTLTKKANVITQRVVTRKSVEYPKGQKKVDEPIEDVVELPVETMPAFKEVPQSDGTVKLVESFPGVGDLKPSETIEEVRDETGRIVKRIITRPKPIHTKRLVFKKVIYTPEMLEGIQKKVAEAIPEEVFEIATTKPNLDAATEPLASSIGKSLPGKEVPEELAKLMKQPVSSKRDSPLAPRKPATARRTPSPDHKAQPSDKRPTSSERRTPSPDRKMPSPEKRPTSAGRKPGPPERKPGSPERKPVSTEKRQESPEAEEVRGSPERSLESPDGTPGSPEKKPGSLEKRPRSPEKRPGSPKKRQESPERKLRSPDKRPGSPEKAPESTETALESPKKAPESLDSRLGSPDKIPGSPDKRPRSSDKRPGSSDKRPGSPERRARSPEKRPSPGKTDATTKRPKSPTKGSAKKDDSKRQSGFVEHVVEIVPSVSEDASVEAAPELPWSKSYTVKMTPEEKEKLSRQVFRDTLPEDSISLSDISPPRSPIRERSVPRRVSGVVRRMSYQTKRAQSIDDRRVSIQSIEEVFTTLGKHESKIRLIWEQIVDTEVDYDSFILWLTFVEREVATSKPVVAKLEPLMEQKLYHKVC